MVMPYRVALFGGSFDPAHLGHLYIAEQLIDKGVVDCVEFVPAYVSYHGKDYGASPIERCDMLRELIVSSPHRDCLAVNMFEIDRKMKTSTYDFVDKLFSTISETDYNFCRYGMDDIQYYFVIGSDNATMIPSFKKGPNSEMVIDKIPFIVVNRGDDNIKNIEWCSKSPHIIVDIGDKFSTCSSSRIRELFSTTSDVFPNDELLDICDISVFSYILDNDLYSIGDSDENN
jgi:nicotinate-nucleotide adenylyltransferase